MGRRADRQIGLEARRWALLNLGVKGAIELSLLIVHLTQDHVVLQEEFVSHAKSGKSKQEREAMEGSQWVVGAPDKTQPGWEVTMWEVRSWGACSLITPEGIPKSPWVSPALSLGIGQIDQPGPQNFHSQVPHGGLEFMGKHRNNLPQSQRGRKRKKEKETGKDPERREMERGRDGKEERIKMVDFSIPLFPSATSEDGPVKGTLSPS